MEFAKTDNETESHVTFSEEEFAVLRDAALERKNLHIRLDIPIKEADNFILERKNTVMRVTDGSIESMSGFLEGYCDDTEYAVGCILLKDDSEDEIRQEMALRKLRGEKAGAMAVGLVLEYDFFLSPDISADEADTWLRSLDQPHES